MNPETEAKLNVLRDESPGGAHYRRRPGAQPIDLIEAQRLGAHEAAIVGYVTRWRSKNGIADLQKAKWYLDRLLLLAAAEAAPSPQATMEQLRRDGAPPVEAVFQSDYCEHGYRLTPEHCRRCDERRRAAEIAAYNDGYKGWCE